MADYKKMYAVLCGAALDALDVLPDTEGNYNGRFILRQALIQAEYHYIATTSEEREERETE